ncbi:MAG: precorrin-6A reductase [Actinomycetia bacterium]|nr:precorrin-6A reductase [Actinomycetes bacterium]
MILVFSGTSIGNKLIHRLLENGFKVLASYSSDIGKDSLNSRGSLAADLIINNSKLDNNQMLKLIRRHNIECIIDATHPFAENVSRNAIAAADKENLKYIRFERRKISEQKSNNIAYFDSFKEAKEYLKSLEGNILFTTGIKNIEIFKDIIKDPKKTVYIKILPTQESLEMCYATGVNVKQVIAYYGNWGTGMIKSFIMEKSINIIVTKQSGVSGGELEKIRSVKNLDCKLLIIRRPKIDYPDTCYDFNCLMKKI